MRVGSCSRSSRWSACSRSCSCRRRAQAVSPRRRAGGGPAGRPRRSPTPRSGALAAIGCGIFVRATIVTAGTQVGTIVGAVACCGYMLFDALVVEPR